MPLKTKKLMKFLSKFQPLELDLKAETLRVLRNFSIICKEEECFYKPQPRLTWIQMPKKHSICLPINSQKNIQRTNQHQLKSYNHLPKSSPPLNKLKPSLSQNTLSTKPPLSTMKRTKLTPKKRNKK